MQLQNGAHENGASNGEPRKSHVTERYANVLFAPHEQPKSPVQVSSNIKKTAKEARSKSPVLYSATETNGRYVSPPSAETNGRYVSPPSAETNGRYVSPPSAETNRYVSPTPMRPYQLKQFQNGQTQAQPQENGNYQYQTSYKETPVYNREPPDFYEKLEKIYSPQLPPKQQQPAYREAPRPYKEPEKVYSPPQPEKIYSPPPVRSPEKQEIGSPLGLRRIPKENYMEPIVKGEILNAKHFNPQKLPIPIDEEESRLAKRQAAYKLAERAQYMSPPITKTIFERPPQGRNVPAPVEKIEEERESTQHRSRSPEMKVVPSARSQSPPKPRTQPEPKKQISEWVYDCDATLGNVQIRSKGGYEETNGTTPTPTQNVPILPEHKKPQASPPPESQPAEKQPPAVAFAKQPWEITIRKEVFLPGEKLEDSMEIDLIFSQIISDCKNPNPYRIRSYEREVVNQILYDNRIPKNSLERPYEIPMDCKLQVINTARRWPLYFSRLYAVIEERLNERVFMLLGISETGVRLIARNLENAQDPLIIQDHFEFVDIADIIVEGTKTVTIVTRRNTRIIMSSPQAASIKLFIERFLSGKPKQRTHVIALSDYITKEPNLLSFYKGDIIQIVKNPDSKPPATGVWFYGKLGEKFGWVPADYVKPVEESQYGEAPRSRSDASLLYGTVPRDPRSPITPLSAPYSDYGGFDDQHESIYGGYARTLRGGGGRLTMSEFAINYFRRPKSFGDSIRGKTKKEWTWDEITSKVKYTDKPINHSLLRLESNEADKMAQDTFLCIMRFMGDEALKRGQTYTDCVYELLSVCHRYPPLRDEVYCQIIKQVTSNRSPNPDSLIKGWRLFSILTAYFDSSEMLKPYLMRYLSDIAIDSRRMYTGSAKICLDNLKHTFQFGGRKFILSASEVEAITMGKSVKRQAYHLPGGHKKLISTKSVTVAEEIVQELCLEMNIRGTAEQHEFCLCYILEKNGSIKILNNDEYIMDVTTELDVANEEYVLLLTRSVWISPLRADSPLYIDVLFFQTVPNYVAGFLNILPKEQLTAALLDDTAVFGALLLLSDPYNRDEILTSEIVQNLIPKSILKRSTITLEQWVGRVENKIRLLPSNIDPMEARRMFLEKLEKWPLFGASFFFVKRVNAEKVQLLEAIVAINKHGIRVLTSDTHEMILHHTLNEIETTNQYKTSTGNYIDIRLNPNKDNREVISLETENGGEIARVVAHYTYLIKEKDSFYALDRAIASSEL